MAIRKGRHGPTGGMEPEAQHGSPARFWQSSSRRFLRIRIMNFTEPANELERALSVAACGPHGNPELFRQLLSVHLFVLLPHDAEVHLTANAG